MGRFGICVSHCAEKGELKGSTPHPVTLRIQALDWPDAPTKSQNAPVAVLLSCIAP